MKIEIPIILVKFEKIFPPTFFDVMMNLAVHVPVKFHNKQMSNCYI